MIVNLGLKYNIQEQFHIYQLKIRYKQQQQTYLKPQKQNYCVIQKGIYGFNYQNLSKIEIAQNYKCYLNSFSSGYNLIVKQQKQCLIASVQHLTRALSLITPVKINTILLFQRDVNYIEKLLVNKEQIYLLSLIYDDLASRNQQHLLTYDNFLIFFDLKGLWGAKLFKQFDQDGQHLVTFQQFLYGICRTAKAPMEQKIKLLYSFFQSNIQEGIQFRNFTKMLYNYSKEELKQILVEDGIIKQSELFGSIDAYTPVTRQKISDISPKKQSEQVIQINCRTSNHSDSSFDQAYQSLIKCHDEGTFYEINKNQFTYKVKYSNMNTLIRQFVTEVYVQNGIDMKNKECRLKYIDFQKWILSHKKLFRSYYSAFHTDLWAYEEEDPNYLHCKRDLQFNGKIESDKIKGKVYGILIQDMIIFFENNKKKKHPIKVICLEGLNIKSDSQYEIQISNPSGCYKKTMMLFSSIENHRSWLEQLKMYQRDSLHQNYLIAEVIGTGKFSIVYRCIEKLTQKTYALKVMQTDKLTQQATKMIKNESKIMKILNHPQLIKYKETIHTKTHYYIITEYVYGEDLFEYVKKRKNLNQFESAFIIGNIIKAVNFLHGIDIVHRDLKPQNIMVLFKKKTEDEMFECTSPEIRKGQRVQDIKLIDFGLSNLISQIQENPQSNIIGTPNYIAPQILLGEKCTFKSDNFSIGGILYFLLSGTLPFYSSALQKTLINTVKGKINLQTGIWKNISCEAKDLIEQLLEVEPSDRISLNQALNHDWFTKAYQKSKSGFNTAKKTPDKVLQYNDHYKRASQSNKDLQTTDFDQSHNRNSC